MLKRDNLAEQAYEELVNRIVSGACPAGAELREEKLTAEFGISRTPVREALRRLAAEGLAERAPGKGLRVSVPDAAGLRELFACRALVEKAALAAAAPRIPPAELRALRAELAAGPAAAPAAGGRLAADDRMHSLLAEWCGNRYLAELVRRFILKTSPYRGYRDRGLGPDAAAVVAERLAVVDALLAGDAARAAELLEAHIMGGVDAKAAAPAGAGGAPGDASGDRPS